MFGIRQHAGPWFGRRLSLRVSLILLVVGPGLVLAGLGGYAASAMLGHALHERAEARLVMSVGASAYEVLASLQEERRLTATWQAAPTSSRAALETRRRQTDAAVSDYRRQAEAVLNRADAPAVRQARAFRDELEDLSRQRAAVDSEIASQPAAFAYYTDAVTRGIRLQRALSRTADGSLAHDTAAVASLAQVTEMISREDALLSAALVRGRMDSDTRTDFAGYVAAQRLVASTQVDGHLPDRQARAYDRITSSPQWDEMASIEDSVAASDSTLPARADTWREVVDRTTTDLRSLRTTSFDAALDQAAAQANGVLLRTSAGIAVGLLALVLAGLLIARAACSLRRRLSTLRENVQQVDMGLPEIAARLERGEEVDLTSETEGPDLGGDEVGQLAADVAALRRTAETTVVQQARAGEGTTRILVNLARRTQILVHREISMLDAMERVYEDPELLEKLFAVDHTATRVRRHAENLLLLAGSHVPGGPNETTPLVDVLRSAVSEIEDYTRVTIATQLPRVSLAGPAGTDLIHLVAELLENGAFFSPPHTKVELGAEEAPNGLVIEIEDRGLGMKPEDFRYHNERLANPPVTESALRGSDARLGLFVVERLARRHGIEVSLRRSRYGGTCAVVLVPKAVLKRPGPAIGVLGLPPGARVVEPAGGEDATQQAPDPAEQHGDSAEAAVVSPAASGSLSSTLKTLRTQSGSDVRESERSFADGADYEGEDTRPAEDDTTGDPPTAQEVTDRGFPRRVKGANLPRQLHEPAAPPRSGEDPAVLSTEQISAALAAIQRGSSQARAAASAVGRDTHAGTHEQDRRETRTHTKDDGDADEDSGR